MLEKVGGALEALERPPADVAWAVVTEYGLVRSAHNSAELTRLVNVIRL